MSIIVKHIWRNIKENSFRSLLVIFSLALAAAVFYLNINISRDVNDSTVLILQGAYKGYDVIVSGEYEEQNVTLPEYSSVIELKTESASVNGNSALVFYGDIQKLVSEGILVIEKKSRTVDYYDTHCVLMPKTKALFYNLSIDDKFVLETDGTEEEYILAGYVESSGMIAAENSQQCEVYIQNEDISPNLAVLSLVDDTDINAVCEKYNNSYEDISFSVLYNKDATNERVNSIKQVLSVVLLLVIAIAFFVVSSTNSLIINYRIPILGTFRSIGATAFETNLILIFENLVYGLLAGVLGLIFGELLRLALRTFYLGTGYGSINLSYVILVPVFSVTMNVIITLMAIVRTGRTPIKDLMFRKQSVATKPSLFLGILGFVLLAASFVISIMNTEYSFILLACELFLAIAGAGLGMGLVCSIFSKLFSGITERFFGGAPWLGVKNLGVSRINRSTSLLVSIVIALVMMVYICISSISGFFANYENNYPYDIIIKGAEGEESDFEYFNMLEDINDVVFEYWDFQSAVIDDKLLSVQFVANDGYSGGIEVDEDLSLNLTSGEIIVDYMFAKVNGFTVGQTLSICPHDGNGELFKARIVGLCESGVFNSSRTTIMLCREDFFKYIEVDPAIIGISTSIDVYDMISTINYATSWFDGKIYRVTATKDYVNSEVSEAMNAVKAVSVVPILTIILAFLGLANNQLISFNQKSRDYAVLYSTSMSFKQLTVMILTELFASFFVGCSVGLLLSVWLTKIMRDIIFISVAYVPMVITIKQIALSLMFMLILLVSTAFFPISRIKNMNVVKEIKYE